MDASGGRAGGDGLLARQTVLAAGLYDRSCSASYPVRLRGIEDEPRAGRLLPLERRFGAGDAKSRADLRGPDARARAEMGQIRGFGLLWTGSRAVAGNEDSPG